MTETPRNEVPAEDIRLFKTPEEQAAAEVELNQRKAKLEAHNKPAKEVARFIAHELMANPTETGAYIGKDFLIDSKEDGTQYKGQLVGSDNMARILTGVTDTSNVLHSGPSYEIYIQGPDKEAAYFMSPDGSRPKVGEEDPRIKLTPDMPEFEEMTKVFALAEQAA